MTLTEFFTQNPKAALGLSGGVDSAYLLYAGLTAGADVRPYYIETEFQPAFERADAQRLADQLGVALTVVPCSILKHEAVAKNPENRCYYCKTQLFGLLHKRAAEDGFSLLVDGTNASDDVADRPGMQALRELAVRSPLRECGLTKPEIRRLAREAGLHVWDKPSYACLATRVPSGVTLTAPLLQRVEQAENALFAMGFTNLRVRVYGEAARIQLPAEQMAAAFSQREAICAEVGRWFAPVLLDLEAR